MGLLLLKRSPWPRRHVIEKRPGVSVKPFANTLGSSKGQKIPVAESAI